MRKGCLRLGTPALTLPSTCGGTIPLLIFLTCKMTPRSRQTWFPSASFQPIWQTIMFPITLSSFQICKMMLMTVPPAKRIARMVRNSRLLITG